MRRLVVLLFALLLGCGGQTDSFRSTNLSGVDFGRDFHLTDHNGKPRSLADFRGKVVVLSFGYTSCKDVCLTTLSNLSMALKQLGGDAEKVQVLFATVDPERDTPALLAKFVPSFNPTFLGLYGDAETTAKTMKEFHAYKQMPHGDVHGGGAMIHSATGYVFDASGKLRLSISADAGPDVIAHDLALLLKNS